VFLVRDSVHFRGDYTLSVVYFNKVEHYRVILRHNKLEIDGGDCRFDTLFDLVEVTRHECIYPSASVYRWCNTSYSLYNKIEIQCR